MVLFDCIAVISIYPDFTFSLLKCPDGTFPLARRSEPHKLSRKNQSEPRAACCNLMLGKSQTSQAPTLCHCHPHGHQKKIYIMTKLSGKGAKDGTKRDLKSKVS